MILDITYNEIEAALRAMDAELAAHPQGKLLYIAPYLGQYVNEKKVNGWNQPAALIELSAIEWDDYNSLSQTGKLTVNIHIVMKSYADGWEKSRDKAKFLELYSYPGLINKGLQGHSGTHFTGLMRRADVTDIAPDGLYVHVIRYETVVQDKSTSRKNRYIMTEPDSVDLELEKQ